MHRISVVLALALLLAPQAPADDDCPADDRIRNLRYVGATWTTPRRVTYSWDVPRGPSPRTVYEVRVARRASYCAPGTAMQVYGETPEPTYTLELDEPDQVYELEVRVKGCPFIRSETRFLDDSFTAPPVAPRVAQALPSDNAVQVTLADTDSRTLFVGLERAEKGSGFEEVAKLVHAETCAASREHTVDDEGLAPATYIYRAFAQNQGTLRRVYSAPVEVTVGGVAPPRVTLLRASPPILTAGEAVTLSWQTEGATKASIAGLGDVLVEGSISDRPAETTTYTLHVSGPGGQAESSVRVTVLGSERAELVVPTVVSAAGQAGAYYRTSVQVNNPGADVALGRLVFRRIGKATSADDPTMTYKLQPGETIAADSLLESLRAEGSGSLDVFRDQGSLPLVTARITNEAPGGGTTGLSLQALPAAEALAAGQSGVLQAPGSPERYRFSVGARALHEGASLTLVLRRGDGRPAAEATRTLGPGAGFQESAADLFGGPLQGNDSVGVSLTAGTAFVYGTTADNRTNDPQIQIVRARP